MVLEVFYFNAGTNIFGQVKRSSRDIVETTERHTQGENRPLGQTIPSAKATTHACSRGRHLGDGGATTPRKASTSETAVEGHVLFATPSNARSPREGVGAPQADDGPQRGGLAQESGPGEEGLA